MEKFKEFIKNKKDFIFGIGYMVIGEIFVSLYSAIFKIYSINVKDALIIIFGIYFSFEFFNKGFKLLFDKNEV